jgi:(d)CTP diphosphatase
MLKIIDVVAAIIERDGKILLAQRPNKATRRDCEFAGGKVEPGETQPQALVRELREELGIEATPGDYATSGKSPGASSICTRGTCRHLPAR